MSSNNTNSNFLVFRWVPSKDLIGEDCDHFWWLQRGDTNKKRASSLWINVHSFTRWRSSAGVISTTSGAGHPILPDRKKREVQENSIWPLTGELDLSRQMRACLPSPERKTSTCRASWLVGSPGFSLEVTVLSEFHPVEDLLTFSNPHAWVSQR